jgi:hypothetical protein
MAFFGPRRDLSRRNWARGQLSFLREADHAAWTRVVFSHGAPRRVRVDFRVPALSFLRGHSPAHGDIPHRHRVRKDQLEPLGQDVPDGLPGDARGLHHGVRDSSLRPGTSGAGLAGGEGAN